MKSNSTDIPTNEKHKKYLADGMRGPDLSMPPDPRPAAQSTCTETQTPASPSNGCPGIGDYSPVIPNGEGLFTCDIHWEGLFTCNAQWGGTIQVRGYT